MKRFFLTLKDKTHRVIVKFTRAYLPGAKKPYNARVVHQTELNLEQVAEKALLYDVGVLPARIVEGVTAFFTLCYYLTADGYKLKTPLFKSFLRIPGEYDGDETQLHENVFPELRMNAAADFTKYIRERVEVVFDGIYEANGLIGEVLDELTGVRDDIMTVGNIIDVRGSGLKILANGEHASEAGFFFASEATGEIRATVIPVNEPRLLKVLVPPLPPADYTIIIRTQSSAIKASTTLLKNIREIKSDFTVKPA
ncbi:MAG: DUF4469 domain-containing protein [Prevotellaceae bacterium]|jgi:hypothetical protein|nr:DUF4469 domain-containing protein [Prevotellaceae bacterium]